MLAIYSHLFAFVLYSWEAEQIGTYLLVYALVVLKENRSLSHPVTRLPTFPAPKMMMNETIHPGQGLLFSLPAIRPINEARQSFRHQAHTT